MKPILLFAALIVTSTLASAQQAPRWGLGVGTAVSDSVYAGEGTRVEIILPVKQGKSEGASRAA